MEVYLDNSATTKPSEAAINAVQVVLSDYYGNPSSLHRYGLAAERLLKNSREHLAALLNVTPTEVIFTSGGTESNNTAIRSVAANTNDKSRPFITTSIEHPSVLAVFQDLEKNGYNVIYLPVNHLGIIDLSELEKLMQQNPALISIMAVNNEIGSIQPLAAVGQIIKEAKTQTVFHCDAVQAFGKIPLNPAVCGIDLLSASGHKIHAPKGTGLLYVRKGLNFHPLLLGGAQEKSQRPGTENLPGIAGFGAAAEEIGNIEEKIKHYNKLKQALSDKISAAVPSIKINSPITTEFAPNILSISFRGVRGEVLLHYLEQDEIYVSTRSACSSKKKPMSHVLKAIGLTSEEAEGTVRFSFGRYNSLEELDYVAERVAHHVREFRKITAWRE